MKQIKLTDNHIGKYTNGKEVLNICEDLEFEIDYNFNKNAEVYFIADNGIATRKGVVKDKKFVIPCYFFRVGDLKLKIISVTSNKMEEFTVEKLITMTENGEFKTIPEIEQMKETIKEYSNLVETLERKNEILTKLVGGLYDTDLKVGE